MCTITNYWTAPDGGGFGGQVCVGLFCRLLGLFLPITRSLLPITRSVLGVHVYHYQLLDCADGGGFCGHVAFVC